MERIKNLNLYQKGILVLLALLFVGFTVAYSVAYKREGFAYEGAMLYPSEENGQRVYTGRLHGKDTSFTVTAEKAVTFRYGEKIYGPYTVREDPTAIPKTSGLSEHMTGIEILDGEKVFFRGGLFASRGDRVLLPETGSATNKVSMIVGGEAYDARGNKIDRMIPSAATIVELTEGPELTRKCDWECWFYGVIASVITVVSMLFADELFRRKLSWSIQDAHLAEPSEWEIFTRYAGWTVLTVLIAIMYVVGLMK